MSKHLKTINLLFKYGNKLQKIKLNKNNLSNSVNTLLDIAKNNNIDIEAACDSSLACSTCHIILDKDIYDKINEPCEDEFDMLEIAPDLTETSRLSCQINLSEILSKIDNDNININIPQFNKNSKYE